ncbi:hypothetical protein IAT38_003964 [Cryptococcus sp. DSM 104549]
MSASNLPTLDKYVAIDCEMIRCNSGMVLAKVGIVDAQGEVVFESYVFSHPDNVVDYITNKSGITAEKLVGAPTYETVQPQIVEVLKGKIVVGHTLFNDFTVIQHRHPYEEMRDTALYYPLRKMVGVRQEGVWPGLKTLAEKVLGKEIHKEGEAHDPVVDARTTMEIFMTVREAYEDSLFQGKDVVACIPE